MRIRKKHATIRINLETKLGELRGKETEILETIRSEIAVESGIQEKGLIQLALEQNAKQPEIDTIKADVLSIDKDSKDIINEIEASKSNKIKKKNQLASLVFDLETYRLAKWWYGKDDPMELKCRSSGFNHNYFLCCFRLNTSINWGFPGIIRNGFTTATN